LKLPPFPINNTKTIIILTTNVRILEIVMTKEIVDEGLARLEAERKVEVEKEAAEDNLRLLRDEEERQVAEEELRLLLDR